MDRIKKMEEKKRVFYVKIIRVAIPIVILLLGFLTYKMISSQKKAPESSKAKSDVKTYVGVPIKLEPIRAEVKVYGTVQSAATISVSAETTGRIISKRKDMKSGTVVKKDDVLIKIDPKNYEITLSKAEAEIERLKAEIEKQKVTVDNAKPLLYSAMKQYKLEEASLSRNESLKKRQIISTQSYDDIQKSVAKFKSDLVNAEGAVKNAIFGLNSLNAQLKSAETVKQEAKLNLERCVIKSPIDGRLINITANYGEYVNVGTALFSVVDDSALEIPVSLSVDEIGMILDFTPDKDVDYGHWFKFDSKEKIVVEWADSSGAVKWNGKIVSIEKFDLDTRTITVLVKPTEPIKTYTDSFPLVAGLFCKVIFTGKEIKGALKVPLSAVQINGCVYVIDKKTGLSKEFPAKIIRYDNYQAIISSKGLKNGDYLITQPLPHGLLNETKVKVVKPTV
jgi:multidrug efflux pump subunit AcrA (membrane-fusion protein)